MYTVKVISENQYAASFKLSYLFISLIHLQIWISRLEQKLKLGLYQG